MQEKFTKYMKHKINCIAIDDERECLDRLVSFAEKIEFLNLIKTFDNAFDAINYLETNKVDLIFLDVMMDDLSGIDLIESLNELPNFIFITSFDEYAVKAFELQATDYIQKPLTFKRFMKAAARAFKLKYAAENSATLPAASVNHGNNDSKEFTFIKTKYKMQKLVFDDIYYIKGLNNYLIIKTKDEILYTIQSFNKIVKVLPMDNFIRVHKSYIIAIDKIDIIGKNQVIINDENIPIGESYKEYFFNHLRKEKLMFNTNQTSKYNNSMN
jgi:DNA-binding LytR/AlgR family response regulator